MERRGQNGDSELDFHPPPVLLIAFLQSKTLGCLLLLGTFLSLPLSTILSLYLCNSFPTPVPIYLLPSFAHSFLFSFYGDYVRPLFLSNCLSSFITATFHFIVSMTFSTLSFPVSGWYLVSFQVGCVLMCFDIVSEQIYYYYRQPLLDKLTQKRQLLSQFSSYLP
jgi:hypothetical protein